MTDHHHALVQRVVDALEERRDPESLVWSYFDEDREAVIQAAQQTLEATREDSSRGRVEAAVDRELIEALRFPEGGRGGLPARLYLHRRPLAAVLLLVASALAFLLV